MKIACRHSFIVALAALGAVNGPEAIAQSPRDPTQPPAVYTTPSGGVHLPPADAFRPEHLVTVDGVRYLVWKGKRHVVGDTIDGMRIERISESAIWLRGANGVRKISLFSSIEKRPPNSDATLNSSTRTSLDGKNGPLK